MQRTAILSPQIRPVRRFGLATRGGCALHAEDIDFALERGIDYFNWCGHDDGLSQAVKRMGFRRRDMVLAVQLQSRTYQEASEEFRSMLDSLGTDFIDVVTLYYVESDEEWETMTSRGGAREYLEEQKQAGRLRLIGLTSHQRKLAANWSKTGLIDLLMIRYNAAHRGAEEDVFRVTSERKMPVVSFTGLRWKALLKATPEDPPDFVPPSPADCYRFCLANEDISVVLSAPANRSELEENLKVLDDWCPPSPEQLTAIRQHGERVRRHAGPFW